MSTGSFLVKALHTFKTLFIDDYAIDELEAIHNSVLEMGKRWENQAVLGAMIRFDSSIATRRLFICSVDRTTLRCGVSRGQNRPSGNTQPA